MSEKYKNSWESCLSLDELLEIHFKDAIDYVKEHLKINISPEEIACFCRENFIGYPKLFTKQLFEIISETITRKCEYPDVRYFHAPKWLDVKGQQMSLKPNSHQELKDKLPNIPENTGDTPDYSMLARTFLSSFGT